MTKLLLVLSLVALIGIFFVLRKILEILVEWKIDWDDTQPDIEIDE